MKAWGGRFQKDSAAAMNDFHSSIHFDCRLAEEDIRGSIAHARMLGDTGIISQTEAETIIGGLMGILAKVRAGQVTWDPGAEDIHMNIEKMLVQEMSSLQQFLKMLHTDLNCNR